MKSSQLSKVSVMTPPTNLSVASSAFLSRRYDDKTSSVASRKSRKQFNEIHSTVSIRSKLSKSGLMAVGDSISRAGNTEAPYP
jgi:hypothetical protein